MFIGTIPIRSCQSFKSLDAFSTLVQPRMVVALITRAYWKCGKRSILLLWRIKGRINNFKIHFCWIQEKGSMKKPTDGVEMFKPLLFSTHHWKHSHEDIFTFFCFISNNICGGAAGEHNCEESHKSIFSHWLSKSLWPIIEMSSTFVFRIKFQFF